MKEIIIICIFWITADFAQERKDYSPIVFGFVQCWYQADFSTEQGEFLIKYARLGIKGNVSEYAGYRLLADFSRLGKMQTETANVNGIIVVTSVTPRFSDYLLDALIFVSPLEHFTVNVGQFKIPFGTDNIRAASDIEFEDRPLLVNVTPGLRDIGFTGSYKMNDFAPVELIAGLFNGAGQNKTEDDKTSNYVVRTVVTPVKELGISANYYGGKISGFNINMYNFGFDLRINKIYFDGEFGIKHSRANNSEINSRAYFIYSYYDFEFPQSPVSHLIPALRYEHYQPNTSGGKDEINRTTIGLSLEFAKIKFARLRINYELYDYKDGSKNPNKIIVSMQTKF